MDFSERRKHSRKIRAVITLKTYTLLQIINAYLLHLQNGILLILLLIRHLVLVFLICCCDINNKSNNTLKIQKYLRSK